MSLITTFENQCRALTGAASPDENASRFLVGTLSPRSENTINLFEYRDDNNNLAKVSFRFPDGELWHLSTPSKYPRLFAAVVGRRNQLGISVYKLPKESESSLEDDFGLLEVPIEKSFDLSQGVKNLTRQSHWHPDDKSELLICNDYTLEFWDVEQQGKIRNFSLRCPIEKSVPEGNKSQAVDFRWSSLFNCSVVAAAVGPRIFGIDTRVPDSNISSICWLIEDKECNKVRSIDFNPNSQYYLASGGDDCRAKFWDLRQTAKPVLRMQPHTHWIWGVRYNPFHDQLVLTAGGDARVSLLRAQSIASEPYGRLGEEDGEDDGVQSDLDDKESNDIDGDHSNTDPEDLNKEDRLEIATTVGKAEDTGGCKQAESTKNLSDEIVKIYEEHDDSVYAIEWATDPWVFASLGFESRLVINKVPKAEKFNILF